MLSPLPSPHARPVEEVLAGLQSSPNGLGQDDAAARLQHYGRNTLPASEPPGIVRHNPAGPNSFGPRFLN